MPRVKGVPRQYDRELYRGFSDEEPPSSRKNEIRKEAEETEHVSTGGIFSSPSFPKLSEHRSSDAQATAVSSEFGGSLQVLDFPQPPNCMGKAFSMASSYPAAANLLTHAAAIVSAANFVSSTPLGVPMLPLVINPQRLILPLGLQLPENDPPQGTAPDGSLDSNVPFKGGPLSRSEEGESTPDFGLPQLSLKPASLQCKRRYFLPEKLTSPKTRDRDKEIISCSVCGKLMRRGSIREHMDRHDNSGKFECSHCGKNFSRASAREKHLRTHTGERPYVCGHCPKAYRQKVHLNEHMRSHTGERPYVCRLCGFSLTSKSLLNRHLRTHGIKTSANDAPEMWLRTDAPTEEVLAAAAEVGRSLVESPEPSDSSQVEGERVDQDTPETLKVTALNGTATVAALGRKHLCSLCPAGFPTIQALRSHRTTTHGLVTPHKCSACQSSFASQKSLKTHMRKNHPQICPLCKMQMPQRRRWILEVHIREQHQGISAESVLGPSPFTMNRTKKRNPRKKRESTTKLPPSPSQDNGLQGPQSSSLHRKQRPGPDCPTSAAKSLTREVVVGADLGTTS